MEIEMSTNKNNQFRRLAVQHTNMLDGEGRLDTQILFGQPVEHIRDDGQNYVFVRELVTGKTGRIDRKTWHAEMSLVMEPTHRVAQPTAIAYIQPNFKSPMAMVLSMNALVAIGERVVATKEGEFAKILGYYRMGQAWIQLDQLRPIDQPEEDFVEVALRFVGRDYLWGALTAHPGIDCSGLLLQACSACGIQSPRDSGPQSRELGDVVQTEFTPQMLRRGDMVFWTEGKGRHVAIMVNGTEAVHATISPSLRGVGVQSIYEIVRAQHASGSGNPSLVRRFPNYLPSGD